MSVYVCPVCNGRGKVQNGFYDSIGMPNYGSVNTAPEVCRSCNGTGIVYDRFVDPTPKLKEQGEDSDGL